MRDVAQAADVSIKTVSNVINDHPNIKAETRERVLLAMGSTRSTKSTDSTAGDKSAVGRNGVVEITLPPVSWTALNLGCPNELVKTQATARSEDRDVATLRNPADRSPFGDRRPVGRF